MRRHWLLSGVCVTLAIAAALSAPLRFQSDRAVSVNLECDVCKTGVALARRLLDEGKNSLVPEPMFMYALDHVYLDPDDVCGQYLGAGCSNASIPQFDYFWNISLPPNPKPPVKPILPPKSGAPRLRILHLSDVHIDVLYSVGASADCGLPTCCRRSDGMPPSSKRRAAYWGDYNCDLPWWTADNSFKQIARDRQWEDTAPLDHSIGHPVTIKLINFHQVQYKTCTRRSPVDAALEQFDLIYFTGDLPDHHVWEQTRQEEIALYSGFTQLVQKYFPGVPLVVAMGNHESVPVNSFPPRYIMGNDSMDWLYTKVWQLLSPWIPADQKANVLGGGYYTHLLRPGLRVVSLNMNYGGDLNWWLLGNLTDPDGQYQWFIDVLQRAEDSGEKVHVLGHIPPNGVIKGYSWNYFKIAERYESTIAGHFFGHTHLDNFAVMLDPANQTRARAFGTIYVSGSLKTSQNPSYRIYEVDGNYSGASFQVLSYSNYIFNLTEANLAGQGREPVWFLEYNTTSAYGMQFAFPQSWADLVRRFESDDSLFQKFYRRFTTS
uniref:Sphingomyelin phosphodiesterase n=1 Tax=Macrostomum lignano TaxID=282301 RepID=A0A1I8IP86_9PLAT